MISTQEKLMNPDKTKKTLVIPTYTLNYDLRNLAYKCALSHRDQIDEIIITEDGGMFSIQLQKIADIYIYNKINVGFSKNVNKGWKLSSGGFTFIVNSDIELLSGNLRDMCESVHITSPQIEKTSIHKFTGSYFVVPRKLQKQYGMLNENMKNFSSDILYYRQTQKHFRFEPRVKVLHRGSQTLKALKIDTQREAQKDDRAYRKIMYENFGDELN